MPEIQTKIPNFDLVVVNQIVQKNKQMGKLDNFFI